LKFFNSGWRGQATESPFASELSRGLQQISPLELPKDAVTDEQWGGQHGDTDPNLERNRSAITA
jgi:hypothetical protein